MKVAFAIILLSCSTFLACNRTKRETIEHPTAETAKEIALFQRATLKQIHVQRKTVEGLKQLIEHENPRDHARHTQAFSLLQKKHRILNESISDYRFTTQKNWIEFQRKTNEELAKKSRTIQLLQKDTD